METWFRETILKYNKNILNSGKYVYLSLNEIWIKQTLIVMILEQNDSLF